MNTRLRPVASAAKALSWTTRLALGTGAALAGLGAHGQTAAPPEPAPAQTVYVTATKRMQDINTVPAAVQSISGETLDKIGAYDLQSVINQMPGVAGFSTGNGRTGFSIRGISAVTNGIGASTVGYYVDETPLANGGITPDAALFDVERVEVLRGPQGTLYGEGSLSGTIRIITAKPVLRGQQGKAQASVATLADGGRDHRVSASWSAALREDVLGLRLTANRLRNGGFADNEQTGRRDANVSDQTNLRGVLLLQPSADLSLSLSHDWRKVENTGASMNTDTAIISSPLLGPPQVLVAPPSGERAYLQTTEETSSDRYRLSNLTLDWKLAGMNLVSATSSFDRKLAGVRDARELYATYNLLFASGAAPGPLPTLGILEGNPYRDKVFTQELRLVSGDGGRLRWVLGAFYKDRKVRQTITDDAPELAGFGGGLYTAPDGTPGRFFRTDVDAKFTDKALFADVSADLTGTLSVSAGVRRLHQTIDVRSQLHQVFQPPGDANLSSSTSKTLFKASASMRLGQGLNGYALFSQGLRAGNVNTRAFDPRIPTSFGPDSVDNLELGLKGSVLDGRVSGSAALYRMTYKDIHLNFEVAPGVSGVGNGRRASSQGLELELAFKPTAALRMGGAYSFTDSKTSGGDFLLSGGSTPTPADDVLIANGTRLPNVPRQKFNLFADYGTDDLFGRPGFVRLDYERVGQRDNSIRNVSGSGVNVGDVAVLDGYGILNLTAGVEFGSVRVSAFVRNLGDTVAQFARSPDGLGNIIGRPRTVGLAIDAAF